jgi:AraC-like DNA-binding protein
VYDPIPAVDLHKNALDRARIYSNPRLPGTEVLDAAYKRHSFARHFHETLSFGIMREGIGKSWFRGGFNLALPGHVMIYKAGEVHSGCDGCDEGWTYSMVYVDRHDLTRLGFLHLYDAEYPVMSFANPALFDSISEFVEIFRKARAGADWSLCEILGQFSKLAVEPKLADPLTSSSSIENARDYIHSHYDKDISVEELANIACFSPFHLSRLFKKAYGLPPHSYLMNVRVTKAQELLAKGHKASDVTWELGFYDQSHFTSMFRKYVGVTPGQYAHQAS